jgi:hypothetical protein
LYLRGRKWQGADEDCIMRSFITYTLHPSIFRVIKSRRMRWVGHVERMGDLRNACILVAKPERKRALGRAGSIWEGNTGTDIT